MAGEGSKVVNAEATDTASEIDDADYPLMMLFKRLIGNATGNENKKNTVLTNSQIMIILEKEFNINTEDLHELEMDIYLSIMKKYLKEWPQWDDFDCDINELKRKNDEGEMQKMLMKKYHLLKSYLSYMLNIAIPISKEKVAEVEKKFNKMQEDEQKNIPEEDLSDVILEIQCSRPQINNLIYRHPHPMQNYTIFNAAESNPSKIFMDTPDYYAILNWWNVSLTFKLNSLHFVRSSVHEMKHMLVNNKLKEKAPKPKKLKNGYQEKSFYPASFKVDLKGLTPKQFFVDKLRKIYKISDHLYKPVLEVLYSVLEKDFAGLPNDMQELVSYRKYFCRYPYVRYLYTDVPEAKNDREAMNYDLHLKETITPMYQLDIYKVENIVSLKTVDLQGIHLECKSCALKFLGATMLEQLKQHILENHLCEPDWLCVKCKGTFTMVNLAKNRWFHECKESKEK